MKLGGWEQSAETHAFRMAMLSVAAMGVGLVMVFSTSAHIPLHQGGGVRLGHPFLRHGFYVVASLVLIVSLGRFDYRKLERFAPHLMVISLLLLIPLHVPGIPGNVNGANRWYRIGSASIQPSEFTKIALILFLAWFLTRREDPLRSFLRGFAPAAAVIGAAVLLVGLQPDFGTSIFLASLGGVLLLVGGARAAHTVPLAACGMLFGLFMVNGFDHIQKRIDGFKNPLENFHAQHSLIALGSGGWTGMGLGSGRHKLYYLPQNSSDFIYSIIGEEFGFVGTMAVLILFVLIVWQGVIIALRSEDRFGFYLATGVTLTIGLQAAIHIAVTTASVPTKGIPLPFISLGGSSLVALSLGVGILCSVARFGPNPRRG